MFEKLIDSEDILSGFETDKSRVKVIVNLVEPSESFTSVMATSDKLHSLRQKIKTRQNQAISVLDINHIKVRHRFENQSGFSAEVSRQALEQLYQNTLVESIEPVRILEAHLFQGTALINATNYRPIFNGQGIAIAICDSGIDYTHSKLGGAGFPNSKVIGGYNFGDNNSDPMPIGNAHGTSCAGIAAGDLGTVGDYIGGVAHNAKLYALKITAGSGGSADTDDIVAAWDWCITHQYDDPNNPIMVISTSFGGGRYFNTCDSALPSLTTVANNAIASGITVLVSSGNDGFCDSIGFPACISDVISVGAVYDADFGFYNPCISINSCAPKSATGGCSTGWYATDDTVPDMVASYSNTASFLDLLTPSNRAYTTDIVGLSGYTSSDYTTSFGGTSAACPYAAGAVAVLQQAVKEINGTFLTPDEVRSILALTGDDITDSKVDITKPRVNLGRAIEWITGEVPPTAFDVNEVMTKNTSVDIFLEAIDDGEPNPPGNLTYIITSLPADGNLVDVNTTGLITGIPYSLADFGSRVIYEPDVNFIGQDGFTYKANDGGVLPTGGDSEMATVFITVAEPPEDFYEDFEDGLGIFTIDNDFGAADGLWHITTSCESLSGAHSLLGSLYYGLEGGCDYDAHKPPDGTEGIVTSEQINLIMAKPPIILGFNYFLETEGQASAGRDVAEVQISQDNGPFVTLASNSDSTLNDPSSGWEHKEIDISNFADSNIQLLFSFRTGNHKNNAHAGFYIDDIEIIGAYTGDFEPDGDVDGLDYALFALAWLTGEGDESYSSWFDISEPADDFINEDDLEVFSQNWLKGK
ncbi:MAG: S8 family peptidase [Planctomycetota bacterium]